MYGGLSFFERTDSELILPIQGWKRIYFNPFKEPILILGFL